MLELIKASTSHNLVNQTKHPLFCFMFLYSGINQMNILQAVIKQLLEKFVWHQKCVGIEVDVFVGICISIVF